MFLQSYEFWIFWRWYWKPEPIIKQQTSAEQHVISPSAFYFYLFLIGIWTSIAETSLASWSKKSHMYMNHTSDGGVEIILFFQRIFSLFKIIFLQLDLLNTREIEKTECYLFGVSSNFQVIKLNTAVSVCSISCFVWWSCIWATAFWAFGCGMYSASGLCHCSLNCHIHFGTFVSRLPPALLQKISPNTFLSVWATLQTCMFVVA